MLRARALALLGLVPHRVQAQGEGLVKEKRSGQPWSGGRRRRVSPSAPWLVSRRFWLVIKEDGHMVTARQEPRLVLVSIAYEDDCLVFRAPGSEQLVLPSKLPSSNRVHDCRCSAWGRGPATGPASLRRLLPEPSLCTGGDETGEGSVHEQSRLSWDLAGDQV